MGGYHQLRTAGAVLGIEFVTPDSPEAVQNNHGA